MSAIITKIIIRENDDPMTFFEGEWIVEKVLDNGFSDVELADDFPQTDRPDFVYAGREYGNNGQQFVWNKRGR